MDRATITKIRSRSLPKKAVNLSSLEDLFVAVAQELEAKELEKPGRFCLTDEDYIELPEETPQPKNKNQKNQTYSNSINPVEAALMTLDYQGQTEYFKNYTSLYQIGAFLIQGQWNYGQVWLANRLVKRFFNSDYTSGKLISVRLPAPKANQDIYMDAVWQGLGRELNLPDQASASDCVNRAFEYWQRGTLIICIRNVDALYFSEFIKLLEEFWQPLSQKVQEYLAEGIESCLLMFLIDSRDSGKIPSSNNNTQNAAGSYQVLPVLEKFGQHSNEILYSWVRSHRNLLNCPEPNPLKPLVQDIWVKSYEGIPEEVFKEVCSQCNESWEKISQGLKL